MLPGSRRALIMGRNHHRQTAPGSLRHLDVCDSWSRNSSVGLCEPERCCEGILEVLLAVLSLEGTCR